MAAYAGVASLMNNIEQLMSHPRLSASLDDKQIHSLLEKAASLLDFIEGNNHGGETSKEVEDLERRIASAAHAAEDAIESHIDDQIHAGTSRASLGFLFHVQKMIEDMNGISEKANELKEKQVIAFREEEQSSTYSRRRSLMETTTVMVGFEDELIQLMDELTNQESNRQVISIIGMGGTGKTTLARNLYQNLYLKQHFDVRAWATVSQQHNVEAILSQLLSCLGISDSESGVKLHKALYGRRYLIILDDIWNVQAWDGVRKFFPDNGNGSRVVLTTRLSNVARDCFSDSSFPMKPLDEDKSWKLLCRKAFQQENCPYPELERVGREIVRLSRGLPLSISVVGGFLLKSPSSLRFWEDVVSNIKSKPDSKEKEESLDILSLSYNHLPPHLKPCFLYMGVFEEDSEIRVSRIINLWVAEGFLRPNNTQSLEVVGKGYLEELIDRNLVSVSKLRKNGKIGSCVVHDLVRDLCLKVSEQQIRRDPERRLINPWWKRTPPSLGRSLLAWNAFEEMAANCKLLRVRETTQCVLSPLKLYRNFNLRYLAFDFDQPVWELPSSVSLTWNLQTLIIKGYALPRVVFAPVEIWEMRQLRHVKCSRIHLPSDVLVLKMDSLQTLATALNFRLSEGMCEMIPNIKKLKLLYRDNLHGYDDSLVRFLQNLDSFHKLESLNLSIEGNGQLVMENEFFNRKLTFPTSLNKLFLRGCQLEWDDMWKLASLPELEVLELGLCSFWVGNKWSVSSERFPRLKFLKIECCNLDYWEADDSHFPVLEKLVLTELIDLEEIPLGIGEIPTLELIRVEFCSESAAISALRILQDQMEMGNDGLLQVQVRIFPKDFESFQEKVEAEGLTLDNIHLEI